MVIQLLENLDMYLTVFPAIMICSSEINGNNGYIYGQKLFTRGMEIRKSLLILLFHAWIQVQVDFFPHSFMHRVNFFHGKYSNETVHKDACRSKNLDMFKCK
jgi:hypothetical protein